MPSSATQNEPPEKPPEPELSVVRPEQGYTCPRCASTEMLISLQPGSEMSEAVRGAVVIVPKTGEVPVVSANRWSVSAPVLRDTVPYPPPASRQREVTGSPEARYERLMWLGSIAVPVSSEAVDASDAELKVTPLSGEKP